MCVKGNTEEPRYQIWHLLTSWFLYGYVFIYIVSTLTVNWGVSLLISSRETSIAITPKMSWFWDFWEKTIEKKRSQELERVTLRPTYESCCSFWMSQVPLRIPNDFKEMGCNRNLDSLIPKSFTCRHESLTRHFQPSFWAVVEVTPESFEVDM